MFPPYKYIITRISRNVNKNIRKIRKNSRDFHTTKLNLPTGALDSKTGRIVMDIFHELNEKQKKTIVLITHSMELAKETDRIITLKDGIITGEKINDGRGDKNAYI